VYCILNPSTLKAEAEASGVQSHFQLHSEFKTSLEFLNFFSKTNKQTIKQTNKTANKATTTTKPQEP